MTLVAAYRPEGIPVLIGDFLITGGGQESTKKKIYKVSPNFAVGWSGPAFVAAPILRSLFSEFEDKTVTRSEVEAFFTNRPKDELSNLRFFIVGWVIDEHPHCFLWNILCPTKLFYEPYYVIGSGTQKFQELMTRKSMEGSWGSKRNNVEQAIFSALSKATELYSDENLDRMNRRERFGHGYELLYFDGKEFKYVENIAFFGMDIYLNLDDDFSGRSQPYEFWYRYHSLSNSSFLQILNLRTGAMTLELIDPVFNCRWKDAAFEFTAGSFIADYYCIYLQVQTTQGDAYRASLVLAENKEGPSRYAKLENGVYRFELGRDLMKFIYQNLSAEVEHHKTETIPWGWGSAETAQTILGVNSSYQARIAQMDKTVVLGLINDQPWDKNLNTMLYAIMACPDSTIQIYEQGLAVGPLGKSYRENDMLGISVEEVDSVPTVFYYMNNEPIYRSQKVPNFPLRGAITMKEEGAGVSESVIVGNWTNLKPL
jgi:hypothetical protein